MSFSVKHSAYSDIPSSSSQSAICGVAATAYTPIQRAELSLFVLYPG